MATLVTRYVNPGSSGGNGTTPALSGANAAYASLAAWNTARARNLVTADEIEEVICATSGPADGRLDLASMVWTVDATRYIHIRAADEHRAGTVWNSAKYRIEGTFDYVAGLVITRPYVRVTGLQVRNNSTEVGSIGVYCSPGTFSSDIRLDGLLTRDNFDGGILVEDGTFFVRNCISINSGGHGIYAAYGLNGTDAFIDNCVSVANTLAGFRTDTSNDVTLRNCYAGDNAGGDIAGGDNWTAVTTCRTSDGSQSTTVAAYSTSSGARFANVTAGSENLELLAGSSLIDVGTDLSGSFTTDIIGKTRSGTWDIGAFEWALPPDIPSMHRHIPLLVR